MAVVKGVRENVHFPLYDAVRFDPMEPDIIKRPDDEIKEKIKRTGNVIKFFVNVQNKTKLETNQQEAGVLSHYNTYEARSMRVVVQPPLIKQEEPVMMSPPDLSPPDILSSEPRNGNSKIKRLDTLFLCNFIYNSVATFIVGEKVMIQAPTWFFPSGAGPSNDNGSTNGEPSPEDTFRFAEPIFISHQQNFRVEIEFPRGGDVLGDAVGPAKVWVVVDGYLRRDVQ